MSEYIRRIAFISDTHVGSEFAIFPEGFKDEEERVFNLNKIQKKLLFYWEKFVDVVNEYDCDSVFHLGDAIHGGNVKNAGRMLVTPNLNHQVQASALLFRKLLNKHRAFYIISGSGYHKSWDYETHEAIAEKLGGKFLGNIRNIKLKGTNRIMNIAHGESSAFIYRTTLMDREGIFMKYAESLKKIPKADIIIRGHWHSFIHIHLPYQHLVQLPCWMAFEPSKIYLKSYGKMQPDIGGVLLMIDKENRVHIWHFLYPVVNDFMHEV